MDTRAQRGRPGRIPGPGDPARRAALRAVARREAEKWRELLWRLG
ncbi:hypothetical protein [Streptomyces chumphonensis]